jgi:hypothetical protein
MTYAEAAAVNGRDDEHMIYEMMNISQYEDGSVLDCVTMTTYTAAQAASDIAIAYAGDRTLANRVRKDVECNARAAIKNGKTENLAPFVNW